MQPWSPGARLGWVAAVALLALAALETAYALLSPSRAPAESDWKAAVAAVRADYRPGDLLVAAPAWADPILRLHAGDLLPISVLARMDDVRFSRVWVVSQRRAHALEENGRVGTMEARFGALTVRRFEGAAPEVTFDAVASWQSAYVTHWEMGLKKETPCPWQAEAFVCPHVGNRVQRGLVEVDQHIYSAILAPPVQGGIVSVEFESATLGRELVVAAGLHDTWARKSPGTAYLEIWVAGNRVGGIVADNRGGWKKIRIDTSAYDGRTVAVRFQSSSPHPLLRHLAFAAEARR